MDGNSATLSTRYSYTKPRKEPIDDYLGVLENETNSLLEKFKNHHIELKLARSRKPDSFLLKGRGVEITLDYDAEHADDFENRTKGSNRILGRLHAVDYVVVSGLECTITSKATPPKNAKKAGDKLISAYLDSISEVITDFYSGKAVVVPETAEK